MAEVCSVVDTNQFEPDKTQDACGFYGVSLLFHAGKPGQAPTGNTNDVATWADAEYTKYDGADTSTNFNGMDMATLFKVLGDAKLHYQVIGSTELGFELSRLTANYIKAWLKLGYPVLISVAEGAVWDDDLGGSPYSWDTTGYYHIITATGFDGSAILCHDTASIDENGVRRGPRRYDANKLQAGLTSATAVVMPWLTRPTGDFDPIASGGHMIPQNWHDDGAKLTAPNGHYLMHGFRQHIIDAPSWDAADMPIEEEQSVNQVEMHTDRGAGSRQLTVNRMLVYTSAMGVKESACGQEIQATYAKIASQASEIQALDAQLKAAQTPIVPQKIDVPGAIAAIGAISKDVGVLKTALSIQ